MRQRLLNNKSLGYKLNLIFFSFFFIPVMAMIYFGIRYGILTDRYLPYFFLLLLAFSFLGLTLLRKVFDEIKGFSRTLSAKVIQSFPDGQVDLRSDDELSGLTQSFDVMDGHLDLMRQRLKSCHHQMGVLRNMVDLCYVAGDADELLYVALERALALTQSDVGSILLLEQPEKARFIVKAAIGLDERVELNATVDFESSIAKYAVLNQAALVVEDIEKDIRFGRAHRSEYATKSFICLPIKTSREIIGVLTISHKNRQVVYSTADVEIVEPLMSLVGFTFENLHLAAANRRKENHLRTLTSILETLHSGLQGSPLLHAGLAEVAKIVPFDAALLFRREPNRPAELELFDMLARAATPLSKGDRCAVAAGGLLDRLLKQQSQMLVSDTLALAEETGLSFVEQASVRPILLMPLKLEGEVVGLWGLTAANTSMLMDHLPFIDCAGWALSLALERSRLQAAMRKRNRELDSIKQIGNALATSTFDIRQVLDYTMEMIRVLMNVEAGALYLAQEGELDLATAFNIDAARRKPVRLKLGQGVAGYVAARGEAIMVNPSQAGARFVPPLDADKAFEVRSTLCVPMISQGRVIGAIEVLNKATGDFAAGDQDLLQAIAASVSIALENAHLYRETVTMAETERGLRRVFQKFVPKQVLEKMLDAGGAATELIEELRTLTLINVDIRGFSILVKQLGPRKTVRLLNSFFTHMGAVVFKHHGIVDKYLGDGFLAIFGAPVSDLADADHAIHAALAMLAGLEGFNAAVARELGVEVKIGISVHTGEVVVGNIGFDKKMDYTVIGDAVNDVFRLQDLVRPYPNRILISANTRQATRLPVDCQEMAERLSQMPVYMLQGLSA
jgi:class 3 adenylate cyclase/putative methionine-R-sulfoxide reductase with GAF domain